MTSLEVQYLTIITPVTPRRRAGRIGTRSGLDAGGGSAQSVMVGFAAPGRSICTARTIASCELRFLTTTLKGAGPSDTEWTSTVRSGRLASPVATAVRWAEASM